MSEQTAETAGEEGNRQPEDRITIDEYIAGSALASVDAKIAQLDSMFERMCKQAGRALAFHLGTVPNPEPSDVSLIKDATVDAVARHLTTCKNVIVLTGAGISTAAGIPDFRTPGSGLYDNVQQYLDKYKIDSVQKLFSFDLFLQDPEPFYALARELKYPSENIRPTLAHFFIKLLNDKGVLLRNYTQNIDMLQTETGIPDKKVFEVHGSFRTGTCMQCFAKLNRAQLKEAIFSGEVARCKVDRVDGTLCNGVIKPDIVMFGQQLPQDYMCSISKDVGKCDLLIVMGTSLQVGPVNNIPNAVPNSTPRLLINMEKVCTDREAWSHMSAPLFLFDHPDNKRDVFMGGQIDESVRELAKKIGWWEELSAMQAGVRQDGSASPAGGTDSRPCKL